MNVSATTPCLSRFIGCLCLFWALAVQAESASGLLGEYYSRNSAVSDFFRNQPDFKPTVVRADRTINFPRTGEELPGTGLKDFFVVRWTGKIHIEKYGNYTFHLASDDGSRLRIYDRLVIENDGLHDLREKSGSVDLPPGDHDLCIDYFENDTYLGCQFFWTPPGGEKAIVPETVLFHAIPPKEQVTFVGKTGLVGSYYKLSYCPAFPDYEYEVQPTLKRVDATIGFEATPGAADWGEYCFVRWKGRISIPEAGAYTFYVKSDDGSRLFIDGRRVLNNDGLHPAREVSAETELTAGLHVLQLDYFQNAGPGSCLLLWKPPGGDKEIIPDAVLYH
jgi:hypothetical protein